MCSKFEKCDKCKGTGVAGLSEGTRHLFEIFEAEYKKQFMKSSVDAFGYLHYDNEKGICLYRNSDLSGSYVNLTKIFDQCKELKSNG